MQELFIGVDGGATKCTVRVEDKAGLLLGQESSGPANIRISVDQAWQSIYSALNKIIKNDHYHFHVGMGLAGCEMIEAYHAFLRHAHIFKTLIVTSDAHTACLGAHGGKDGAIIIAGTGAVGYQINKGKVSKVSGWGFPYDDQGSGAWIGLHAVKQTLQWLDGRLPESALTKAVYAHFQQDQTQLLNWADRANSTAFAELAPLVVKHGQQGYAAAQEILQRAAQAIDKIGNTLEATLPCALVGGVASFLQPLLSNELRARLRPCLAEPVVGAMFLVRRSYE
jgi:glucosamine kinase